MRYGSFYNSTIFNRIKRLLQNIYNENTIRSVKIAHVAISLILNIENINIVIEFIVKIVFKMYRHNFLMTKMY